MGKGDKKTKKGKIFLGSFGNSRRKANVTKEAVASAPKKPEETAKPAAKKVAK